MAKKKEEKVETLDELIEEIENRREELLDEITDEEGNYDEIELNEILRDEFQEDKYQQALIDAGVNDSDDDLGLNEIEPEDSISTDDSRDKDKLVQTMMKAKEHIKLVEMKLKGLEMVGGKPKFKQYFLIPRDDIDWLVIELDALYSTQSLSGKLHTNLSYFDDSMNTLLNNFRGRLAEYPDKVVPRQNMTKAIDIFLTEINVVRNAIMTGRLGDIARDMVINSYNEKTEDRPEDKVENLKKQLF